MALSIFNSLTKKKTPFEPITPGQVKMYVCGMTVYDYLHLGHARVMVVFDMVVHYLRTLGLQITYIRNITDIDDKIIKRAQENDEALPALTARFIEAMNEDATALGVATPDAEPRATAHMPQILDMIAALIDRDYAYLADNGDVYFRVRRFEYYGRLSGKTLDELRIGARVDVGESKDDPLDFVLWKAAKPGEPSWESPWGRGRPGWHIECSAMSTHCLGNHFDIHGGGMDLKFPHHENEIAQSQASTADQFVNTWMHVGFVRVNEEKMSKSLGNFFTVREVLKVFDPEVVRYFILNSHYRSPLDYSDGSLKQAKAGLTTLYTALRGIGVSSTAEKPLSPSGENPFLSRFYAAMDDDFNTPEAVAVLFELGHEINRIRDEDPEHTRQQAALLRRLGSVLGLLQRDPDAFLQGAGPEKAGLTAAQIEAFIAERVQARKDKNWAQADRIRDSLSNQGIVLEDVAEGTTWRRE